MTYEEAIKKLEDISAQMENGQLAVDALAARVSEAKELVKFCKSCLLAVDEDMKKVLSEEDK